MSKYVIVGAMLFTIAAVAFGLAFTVQAPSTLGSTDTNGANDSGDSAWRDALPTLCVDSRAHAIQDILGNPSHMMERQDSSHAEDLC